MPAAPIEPIASACATPGRETDVHRVGDALVDRLKAALGRHDITLPSLRADFPLGDKPLIALGRANQETVEKLTALLDSIPPASGR
jgi:hypothetical protein